MRASFHLNGTQIEGEARVALPPLRADARKPLPEPRRGHAHDLSCGRTRKEGGKNHNREPLHEGKQRNQTTAPRAYPAKSGGDGGGWRRRRGDARRGTSRRSVPCRTNALARCTTPPKASASASPSPCLCLSPPPRLSAAIRAGTHGWLGRREAAALQSWRARDPTGGSITRWFVWLATWRF